MRWKGFRGASIPISNLVAQVLVASEGLPSTGLVGLHFANICTRLVVRADSTVIMNVQPLHYRKWLERFSQANFAQTTAGTAWSIWFNFADIPDDDLADQCQFPRGASPSVEFTTNASAVTGNLYVGWTISDQAAVFYPRLIGQPMNLAASLTNAAFPIKEQGLLRGAMFDTTNLGRLALKVGGFIYEDLPGPLYNTVVTGNMTVDSERIEDGVTVDAVTAAHRLPMIPAPQGSSEAQLDTGAGWLTANELTLWAAWPQTPVTAPG
jgi:hypothetical protein